MKLRIETIANRGVPNLERIHLSVAEPTNLSFHMVMASAYQGLTAIANGGRLSFWFPPVDVQPGDQLILYTRAGVFEKSKSTLFPNHNLFFFFWGLAQTVWNTENDCAVVLELLAWQTSQNSVAATNAFATLMRGMPTDAKPTDLK